LEFVQTTWKSFALKMLELLFPIAPICRWYPASDAVLECVGYHAQQETIVYRLTPQGADATVFFVNYKPDPPAWGGYIRPLFNVPQLDFHKFLRPPFDKDNDAPRFERLFRSGIVEQSEPIPMTGGARDVVRDTHLEVSKGLWLGLAHK